MARVQKRGGGVGDAAPAPPVFFVHTMKTGGTSLQRALRQHFLPGERYPTAEGAEFVQQVVEKVQWARLLAMPREQRQRIRYYSVHMPAWVAGLVAPTHFTVTLVREPVARTVSHLQMIVRFRESFFGATLDLPSLWEEPAVRSRLANYQTQMFADPSPSDRDLVAAPPDIPPDFGDWSDEALTTELSTAIRTPRIVTHDDLQAAVTRLSSFDAVGISDRLIRLTEQLSRRLGVPVPEPGRFNITPSAPAAPPTLLDSIRDHTTFDLELFAAATEIEASTR